MEQQVGILRAQLARKTGCNLETIRYYEKVGLLPGPPRSSNGYRVGSVANIRDRRAAPRLCWDQAALLKC